MLRKKGKFWRNYAQLVRRRLILLFVSMLMLQIIWSSACVFAADETEEDARTAISEARSNVLDCYAAVVDAEKSGANVTDLLRILNEAGMLLSKANFAYNSSDFNSAVYFANQTQTSLNGFFDSARILKDATMRQNSMNTMVNTVAFIGVICGGFVVWFFLKMKYGKTGSVKHESSQI